MSKKRQLSTSKRASSLIALAKNNINCGLLSQFSDEALRKIAVDTVYAMDEGTSMALLLSDYQSELKEHLNNNMENAKLELFNSLEDDAEISEERQAKMTPAEKVDEYLKSTCGVYGYTDDILRAVSAAYGILLEPDL